MSKAMTVQAAAIPQHKREQLARPLLKIVREAFEDPRIAQEFKDWQEARNHKTTKDEVRKA